MPEQVDIRTTLEELLAKLTDADNATFQVNIARKTTSSRVQSRMLNFDEALTETYRSAVLGVLASKVAAALDEMDGIAEFSYDAFKSGRLAYLPLEQIPSVQQWMGALPSLGSVPAFKGDKNFLASLKFLYTETTFGPDTLRTFKSYSPSRVIKKGILAAFLEYRYTEVLGDNILSLDDRVDFFEWKNVVFVSAYGGFELVVDLKPITQTIAAESFASVSSLLPVSDSDGLKEAILANRSFLRLVAGLGRKNNVSKMNMKRIAELIKTAKLRISIQSKDGVDTLFVDSSDKEQVRAYLRLLRDDYVQSLLTDIRYIGIEKAEMI